MLVMNETFSCQDADNIMTMITLSYGNDPAQPKVGTVITDSLVNAEVPKTCIPLFDQQGPPKFVAKKIPAKDKSSTIFIPLQTVAVNIIFGSVKMTIKVWLNISSKK